MKVTQVAPPERKPDVLVRLTPEEATLIRRVFANQETKDIAKALGAEEEDAEVQTADDLFYDLYDSLDDLGY